MAPSPTTRKHRQAAERGARHADIGDVELCVKPSLEAGPDDVLECDAILLGTTQHLGYMSGALKDLFDRSYSPWLEKKQGLPCARYVRAGHDGTGTRRAVEGIIADLRWKWVQTSSILRGDWQQEFVTQAEALGLYLSAGFESGVF